MLNFGLTELRLVTPRDGWPNPDAGPASAGADIVLGDMGVVTFENGLVREVYTTDERRGAGDVIRGGDGDNIVFGGAGYGWIAEIAGFGAGLLLSFVLVDGGTLLVGTLTTSTQPY